MNTPREQPCCDYCGLPLNVGLFQTPAHLVACASPQYCCSGCLLAAEIGRERGDAAPVALLTRLGFAIFLTMNVVCFTMVLWSDDIYIDGDPSRTQTGALLADIFRCLSLLFSWPVAYLLAEPMVRNAWQQMRRGVLATDLLLVLGVAAAFGYSTNSVLRGSGHIYFEVGCVVLVFVTLGRWLETTGKQQANAALDALAKLLPSEVRRVAGRNEETIPLEQIVPGDRLRILPGERLPTDGRIASGQAAIDEQLLTGESQPSIKEPGDSIYCGTLNLDGQLIVEVTVAPNQGTLRRLVNAVAAARRSKGHYQRLADWVAARFLPLTLVVVLATFAWHWRSSSLEQAFFAAMAVTLIACPCALGLATPLAVWTAIGSAARNQVVFRHGEALERLAAVRAIFFDKTGTLSTGKAQVTEFVAAQGECVEEIHRIAGCLATASPHPLSVAVGDFARPLTADATLRYCVRSISGRGLVGRSNQNVYYFLGSLRWMHELSLTGQDELQAKIDRLQRHGAAIACVAWNGQIRGVYACEESLRPDARPAIDELRSRHLHLEVLSGDSNMRARIIGDMLAIQVRAELLPEDKVSALRDASAHWRPIAMVGDGINDAPALAAADVGIAMGCGADVSRDAADVCLLSSNLNHLVAAIDLARRTVRVIRQNLFWAFAYNVVGIGLACTGKLNPMLAAAAMTLSSVIVITNSLRLSAGSNGASSSNGRPPNNASEPMAAYDLQRPACEITR